MDRYYQKKGGLFIISAPSGTGKTTICRRICEKNNKIKISTSYTTRLPRQDEINNIHYTFITKNTFDIMIKNNEFIEWAEVYGNFYGTSKERLEKMMNQGFDVLFDIDVQGAKAIKEHFPESILIFILPPSLNVLKKRLTERMSDTYSTIELRFQKAKNEIKEYKNYDYVIVNNSIDEATDLLFSIIISQKAKKSNIENIEIMKFF